MPSTSALKAASSAPLSSDLRRLHCRASSLHSSSTLCSQQVQERSGMSVACHMHALLSKL